MGRRLKGLFVFINMLVALVAGVSLAYGQNFGVLTGDVSEENSVEPAEGTDAVQEQEAPEIREPLSGPIPQPAYQPASAPVPGEPQAGQAAQEETVTIDPLSDENLQEIVAATKQTELTQDEVSRYTLGPTDIIQISVMRHPEVSGIYEINKEGRVQYEFVGDIVVNGLTKDDAAKAISDRLAEYIVNPEVTVKIAGYNSKIVYVVGEVGRPGKIFMRGNTITVREALLEAGLPLLSGVTKKTSLITPSDGGKIEKKIVNVYALLYQGDLRENLTMNPGDVLYIPPTFLTKTMRAISPITQPISESAGTAGAVGGAPGL